MKTKKLLIAILSVMLLVVALVGITSCKKKQPENVKLYFLEFYTGWGENARGESIECKPGDVLTAPNYPEQAGIAFDSWFAQECSFSVKAGEQFTVTEEMFYEGPTFNEHDEKNGEYTRTEYYGSFNVDWDYENYVATIHANEDTTTIYEFTIETSDEIYREASFFLLASFASLSFNYDGGKLEGAYHNGYVFDGWYLDENYQTPLDITPNFTKNVDIYAKWTYTGLFFEYGHEWDYDKEKWFDYYTLTKIENSQAIQTLTIPKTCNGFPVCIVDSEVHQGTGTIGKLILPDTIKTISSFAFSSNLIGEIVIGDDAIIESNAFYGSQVKVTLSSSNTNYVVGNNVLYDLINHTVHSVLATPSGDVVVPDGTLYLGTIFANSTITSIRIPLSVTQLDNGAFENCSLLNWAIMYGDYDKGVKTIGQNAFKNCSALEYVAFSRDLESIGENAFYGCSNLKIVYYGSERKYEWNSVQKDNCGLDCIVYYYSANDSAQNAEYYAGTIYWHYDQNDMPTTWLPLRNTLHGKTFQVTSAEVTVSDYYWNAILSAKNNNIVGQIFEEGSDLYNAVMNASTKAEFEANLAQIYGSQYCKAVFGEDGTVLVSNDLGTDMPFNYAELEDRLLLHGSVYLKGDFYIDENGNIYEIQVGDEINYNPTMTVRYNYTEVE